MSDRYAVIAGAPKCGTTSLYELLIQNPGITKGEHKELKFFDRLTYQTFLTEKSELLSSYEALFPSPKSLCLDASPEYMYNRDLGKILDAFCPDGKVIIILRDPIDRLISLHKYLYNNIALDIPEDINDFIDAFKNLEEDDECFGLPNALQRSKYLDFINSMRIDFSGDMLLINYEHFRDYQKDVIKSVEDFLGLTRHDYKEKVSNKSVNIRYKLLHRFLRGLYFRLGVLTRGLQPLKKIYYKLSSSSEQKGNSLITTVNRLFLEELYKEEIAWLKQNTSTVNLSSP